MYESTLPQYEYDGSKPAPVPRLNVQYLAMGDFLWRSFTTAKLSSPFNPTSKMLSNDCTKDCQRGYADTPNQTLAEIMSSYWISFAVTQDPNPLSASIAPCWPSYMSGGNGTTSNGESVGFDVLAVTAASIGVDTDPDASAQCDFFGSRGYQLAN